MPLKFVDIAMAKNKADKQQAKVASPSSPTPPTQIVPKKATITQRPFWQEHLLPISVLALLSIALYIYSVTFQYALDDMLYITGNQFTQKGFGGLWDIWSKESLVGFWGQQKDLLAGGRYRPFVITTYAIEYALFGQAPAFSHFVNVVLYALLGVVLYRIMHRFLQTYSPAGFPWYLSLPFVVAALYVAHPLHVEWVANIKGRMEILSILFSLLTLYYTFKYLDNPGFPKRNLYLVGSFVVFMLGLFTKENVLTLVGIVPLSIYFFARKSTEKDYLSAISPLLIGTVVFMLLRRAILGYFLGGEKIDSTELLNDPFLGASFGEKYATIFYTMGLYIKLLFTAIPLTHDYYPKQIPIISWADWRALLSLTLYVAIGIYTLAGLRNRQLPAYAIAFYLLSFSLVSNLLFPIGTFMNDRFMDMPSIGFCILLGYGMVVGLPKLLPQISRHTLVLAVFGLYMLFFSIRTLGRVPAWYDNATLFLTDAKVSTNSAKVLTSAGGTLLDVKLPEIKDAQQRDNTINEAITYLNRALNIYPESVNAHLLLANAYFHKQPRNYDSIFVHYRQVLSQNPEHPQVLENISRLSEMEANPQNPQRNEANIDKMLQFVESTATNGTQTWQIYDALGVLYGKGKNNLPKALENFELALNKMGIAATTTANPRAIGIMQDMGVAYGMQRDFPRALAINKRALTLDPTNGSILRNIGITYQNLGQTDSAKIFFDQAAMYLPSNKK